MATTNPLVHELTDDIPLSAAPQEESEFPTQVIRRLRDDLGSQGSFPTIPPPPEQHSNVETPPTHESRSVVSRGQKRTADIGDPHVERLAKAAKTSAGSCISGNGEITAMTPGNVRRQVGRPQLPTAKPSRDQEALGSKADSRQQAKRPTPQREFPVPIAVGLSNHKAGHNTTAKAALHNVKKLISQAMYKVHICLDIAPIDCGTEHYRLTSCFVDARGNPTSVVLGFHKKEQPEGVFCPNIARWVHEELKRFAIDDRKLGHITTFQELCPGLSSWFSGKNQETDHGFQSKVLPSVRHIIEEIAIALVFGTNPGIKRLRDQIGWGPAYNIDEWVKVGLLGKLHAIFVWIKMSTQRIQDFKIQSHHSDYLEDEDLDLENDRQSKFPGERKDLVRVLEWVLWAIRRGKRMSDFAGMKLRTPGNSDKMKRDHSRLVDVNHLQPNARHEPHFYRQSGYGWFTDEELKVLPRYEPFIGAILEAARMQEEDPDSLSYVLPCIDGLLAEFKRLQNGINAEGPNTPSATMDTLRQRVQLCIEKIELAHNELKSIPEVWVAVLLSPGQRNKGRYNPKQMALDDLPDHIWRVVEQPLPYQPPPAPISQSSYDDILRESRYVHLDQMQDIAGDDFPGSPLRYWQNLRNAFRYRYYSGVALDHMCTSTKNQFTQLKPIRGLMQISPGDLDRRAKPTLSLPDQLTRHRRQVCRDRG